MVTDTLQFRDGISLFTWMVTSNGQNQFPGKYTSVCVCAHQSICVVAHVPERNEGQGDPAAILSRDLILTGHHRGYGPPVNQTNMFLVLIRRPVRLSVTQCFTTPLEQFKWFTYNTPHSPFIQTRFSTPNLTFTYIHTPIQGLSQGNVSMQE